MPGAIMTDTDESRPRTEPVTWHATLPLAELPTDGTGRTVEVAGRRIALFRHEGRVHALDDACPHQGASLGDGVLSGGDVPCPFHAWHFDLCSGRNTDTIDACVEVFPARVGTGGVVEVGLPDRGPGAC